MSTSSAPGHTWVPAVAAVAGSALLLKAVLIIASGNAVAEAPMGVLYLGGLLLALAACVGVGLRRRGSVRKVAVAVGCVLALAAWVLALSDAVEPLAGLVSDAAHVLDEAPVGLLGAVLLVLAWAGWQRDTRRRTEVGAGV